MSHMLQRLPYFSFPQIVIRSGAWSRLRPSAKNLYVAILHEVERRSTREFSEPDKFFAKLVGLSPRSVRDARTKLVEYGLVKIRRGVGGMYTYTLCDPTTREPFPGPARERGGYRPGKADPF